MEAWIAWVCAGAALAAAAVLGLLWRRAAGERAGLERLLDRARAEKATLQEAQARLQTEGESRLTVLLNRMGEGVLLLDGEGRIQLVNPAFEALFGVRDDCRGRRVLEALRSHELDELVTRTRESGRVVEAEFEVRSPEARSLQVNAARLGDDPARGMILVFHDLTRVRQFERTRKEFVANVSHELRTPLSLIKGYVETLIDGAREDPAVALRFLQTIARHTDRLTYLIEDLLTISQLESGAAALSPSQVRLRDLVARTLEDLAAHATGRRMALANEVPEGLVARADGDRVMQVLMNLVDNAIKYGRFEGRVVVDGRDAGGEFVEIRVTDDGPGIPKEAIGRLFERFYRMDRDRSRDTGGTGLGLAIVKHIVQSHGGEVRVESESGRGTTFRFTLPRG